MELYSPTRFNEYVVCCCTDEIRFYEINQTTLVPKGKIPQRDVVEVLVSGNRLVTKTGKGKVTGYTLTHSETGITFGLFKSFKLAHFYSGRRTMELIHFQNKFYLLGHLKGNLPINNQLTFVNLIMISDLEVNPGKEDEMALTAHGHQPDITCISSMSDEGFFFSGGQDGIIRSWIIFDIGEKLEMANNGEFPLQSHGITTFIKMSFSNNFLIVGTSMGRVLLLNFDKKATLRIFEFEQEVEYVQEMVDTQGNAFFYVVGKSPDSLKKFDCDDQLYNMLYLKIDLPDSFNVNAPNALAVGSSTSQQLAPIEEELPTRVE